MKAEFAKTREREKEREKRIAKWAKEKQDEIEKRHRLLLQSHTTVAAQIALAHNRSFITGHFPLSPAPDAPSPPFVSAVIVAETALRRRAVKAGACGFVAPDRVS